MKKIGILVYDTSLVGGAERVAINLAEEFSNKYEVHLISLFNEKKEEERVEIKYNSYVIAEETISITKNLFKLSKKLKKYLLENKIDILLAITAGVNSVAILGTINTNIKTIYCEHSNLENRTYGKKHELRQYLGAKFMDKVVTLTDRDRNNFIDILKLPEKKVIVIPNWFTKEEIKEEPYRMDSKKIITVGRLEKVKGHDLLIKVAKKVQEKHKDWIWEIYGDGKYKEKINVDIKNNNLENFVILKGNVTNIKDIYKEYAFFVLTSYYEGLPLVLLEAQQAKLPIVSFNCPTGPAEIVENDKNGYIIPTYDIEEMANKINQLIENQNKREYFSNNAQINMKQFEKDNVLNRWIELIENI